MTPMWRFNEKVNKKNIQNGVALALFLQKRNGLT